jgi:transcriptional regulator with XRE-family HTH domain
MSRGEEHRPARAEIAKAVRALRRERAWTQAELAGKLGLSQSRLSEIESGGGSFTAEQFLQILRLFNVTTSRFTDSGVDRQAQLQNALARLGAHHLQEQSDLVPAEDLDEPTEVVREILMEGEPRLLTALAPVLVANIDRISLGKLYLDLEKVGLERRLGWISENTLAALNLALQGELPRSWAQRARRAEVLLGAFLEATPATGSANGKPPVGDALDRSIRSKKTLDQVKASSSDISRKWDIVSSLTPADFAESLRAARVAHS